MEIRRYIQILWRRKWVIVVTAVMTVTVVVIGTLMATPTYQASVTLRVLTPSSGSVDWVEHNVMYADRLMSTYSRIATSGPVVEELAQRLGLDDLPQIEVEVVANTELMQVLVEDSNPILAREAANTLAEILIAQSRELYVGGGKTAQEILNEQLAQIEDELGQARGEYETLVAQSPEDSDRVTAASRSIAVKEDTYATLLEQYEHARVQEAMRTNTLSILEPATTPQAPAKPRKELNVALGFIVGLAGGIGLAFLFEILDTTLYSAQQIDEVTALTTLGKIPSAGRQPQVAFFNGNSPQAEAFRRLRTSILTPENDVPPKTLLVTSAEPKEGKSTLVANLAFAMAQSGRKVIAVDGDMRRPTLGEIFELSNEVGLSSVLSQELALDEAVQDSHVPGVQVLTSGPLPSNPAELLGSPQMVELIERLERRFDVVLLDTPSLLAVTDAAVLAPTVDGVILVVGRARARAEAVRAACQQLADVKARSVGVVLNRAKQSDSYAYYHRAPTQRARQVRILQKLQKLQKKHVLIGVVGLTVLSLVVGRLVVGPIWPAVSSTPTLLPVVFESTPTFTVTPLPTQTSTSSPTPTSMPTPSSTLDPTPTVPPPPVTGQMAGDVWMRGGPSADSPRIGLVMEQGQSVEVLAVFGDWVQVRWVPQAQAEVIGWVPSRWVETAGAIPARIVTPTVGSQ